MLKMEETKKFTKEELKRMEDKSLYFANSDAVNIYLRWFNE